MLMVFDVMVWEARELFDPAWAAYARALIPLSMRTADCVLTISEHSRAALSAIVPGVPIRIVQPPAPQRLNRPASFSTERRTVLVLGETAPHKNHAAAIAAVAEARRLSGADLRLRLIGQPGRAEGSTIESLHAADPSGIWSTRESGLTDDQLADALASAWVLLQPSYHEGYGLPLIEAAQVGLPVVHSGREGMMDILPESSVGSTESEAFAAGLLTLLDEPAWKASSAYGLARSGLFTWGNFSAAVGRAVDETLAH